MKDDQTTTFVRISHTERSKMKSNFPTVDAKVFTAMQILNIRELSTCKNIRPILPFALREWHESKAKIAKR
jgi:hypothetical protein